jgi:hypothetical protein
MKLIKFVVNLLFVLLSPVWVLPLFAWLTTHHADFRKDFVNKWFLL